MQTVPINKITNEQKDKALATNSKGKTLGILFTIPALK